MSYTVKKITLHPASESGIDNTVDIYPKTTIDQVFTSDGSQPIGEPQSKLISGESIKTINGVSILGAGNISLLTKDVLLDLLYPVGSIYMCDSSTELSVCPIKNSLGGTWERISDTFLYAAKPGTHSLGEQDFKIGDSGGSKDAVAVEHTHITEIASDTGYTNLESENFPQFTISDLGTYDGLNRANYVPIFNGTNGITITRISDGSFDAFVNREPVGPISVKNYKCTIDLANIGIHTVGHYHDVKSSGVSGLNKNMPPYKTVLVWKRIR